ncbi:hypothetical protein ALISP_1083 [Alicycliphilus sp. B1]|nr:hypothetical protein ALISP_1083 [Alicycliphilus sp. B1]
MGSASKVALPPSTAKPAAASWECSATLDWLWTISLGMLVVPDEDRMMQALRASVAGSAVRGHGRRGQGFPPDPAGRAMRGRRHLLRQRRPAGGIGIPRMHRRIDDQLQGAGMLLPYPGKAVALRKAGAVARRGVAGQRVGVGDAAVECQGLAFRPVDETDQFLDPPA